MTAVAIALTIAAGVAGAVQAAVMGELGERTGVFPALAFSGVVSVVLGLSLLLIVTQSLRGLADVAREPLWLWTGGALSVLIILAITVASPRIGLAATIGTIIALNLGMAALSTASAGSASTASQSPGRAPSASSSSASAPR